MKTITYITSILFALLLAACQNKNNDSDITYAPFTIEGRALWETQRLADPLTGKIPYNMRYNELLFAQGLPTDVGIKRQKSSKDWKQIGPFNIGGRTRAFGVDITNENILIAGAISGGMWRSQNGGQTWQKVTKPYQHNAVSCLVQDQRPGKTNVWYAGSGESIGNSASATFSAYYLGNGMLKSTDNGLTWDTIAATVTNSPQIREPWDIIWNVAIDITDTINDAVYAAIQGSIQRSLNGGKTFTRVLGGQSGFLAEFTDIEIGKTGVKYAALSSDGNVKGVFRSLDGETWTNITPAIFPAVYERIVIAIDPTNENRVYFLAHTPDYGKLSNPNSSTSERNSLWVYTYQSGDGSGSGGTWEERSQNIPASTSSRRRFSMQGGYNVDIVVKPDDPNVVFIAGTSLFRSTDAFTTSNNTTQIGGYSPWQTTTFEYRYPKNHPDFHVLTFSPTNNNIMLVANDGGIYRTNNVMADTVVWDDLNRGYFTTQFYTVAIDHQLTNQVVVGGMQDNSTAWTNTDNPNFTWTIPSSGDGSFCAVSNGSQYYYFSSQNGVVYKMELDAQGNRIGYRRIDPEGGSSYLFINPFILDPNKQNTMYVSSFTNIFRHNYLDTVALINKGGKLETGWERLTANLSNLRVTTLEASYNNPKHRLYIGSSSKRVYLLENADTATSLPKDITSNISTTGWIYDIAVDPRNADRAMLVYSNYNVYSIYYTDNGGTSWQKIAGNLEPELPPGFPPQVHGLGDGPSVRCAAIVPVADGTVYFVGTSVGLFATKYLDGDSTKWVQQGADIIGNAVVEMIDVRYQDGFMAAATHGNGVFTNYIQKMDDVVGFEEVKQQNKHFGSISLFPNPASQHVILQLPEFKTNAEMMLVNLEGKVVYHDKIQVTLGNTTHQFPVNHLKNGVYTVVLLSGNKRFTSRLIVSH